MKKIEYHGGFQVRLPMAVYDQLAAYQHDRPHFSLNSIVTEAVIRFLDSPDELPKKEHR